jgi:hypothetical protein
MEAALTRLIALTLGFYATTFAGCFSATTFAGCLALPNVASADEVSPEVLEALHHADAAASEGDRPASIAFIRAAQRADPGSPLLHAARLAHVHQLLPGIVLGLDAEQIDAVLEVDHRANVAHTVGFVTGGAGALAALLGVGSLVWGGIFYRPLSDNVWTTSVTLWSLGGLLALVSIGFHIEGVSRDGEVETMLQFVPTSSGASVVLLGRF